MPQAYLQHRDFVSYALLHIATLQYLDARTKLGGGLVVGLIGYSSESLLIGMKRFPESWSTVAYADTTRPTSGFKLQAVKTDEASGRPK